VSSTQNPNISVAEQTSSFIFLLSDVAVRMPEYQFGM